MTRSTEPVLTGGDVAGEIALGTSFANLVQGQMAPVEPDETVVDSTDPLETKPRDLEERAEAPAMREATNRPDVEQTPQRVAQSQPSEVSKRSEISPPQSLTTAPSTEALDAEATVPLQISSTAAVRADIAITPPVALQSTQPTPLKPSVVTPIVSVSPQTATEPLTAVEATKAITSDTAAPVIGANRSPQVRPDTLVVEEEPSDPPARTVSRPKSTSQGNAEATSRTGQSEGTVARQQTGNTAATTTSRQAGQGAMRSYQSKVLRRVARASARGAGARGTVQVSLAISPTGRLAGVRVARSSGNPRVDRAALNMVSSAGPFGATPKGQSLRFVIRVDVKG
jgi:protein TonB